MQTTNKIGIEHLAQICVENGVTQAVFSPGSRCAPLVLAFHRNSQIRCKVIVDERAAAFYALGFALKTRKPVVLVCTSGTAVLNYAPAIAEAYYQQVPLLVCTADRPVEWIDQADMQTIRQQNIFANYIQKSFQLPQNIISDDDLWYNDRLICEALHACTFPQAGPVHINIPMQEPLYGSSEKEHFAAPKNISLCATQRQLLPEEQANLLSLWQTARRKLIVIGQHAPDKRLQEILSNLLEDQSVAVFTEHTSNFHHPRSVDTIDPLIDSISAEDKQWFLPDILLTVGGMIVSKKIKSFFRQNHPHYHWTVNATGNHLDTFKALTHIIPMEASDFLAVLARNTVIDTQANYQAAILARYTVQQRLQKSYLASLSYSDFVVFEKIFEKLPARMVLHFANSTPVRYANLFSLSPEKNFTCYANRGVGGIDGCSSTAVGIADADPQALHVLITGDLAFFYDSNALWNDAFPTNLRIILMNNSGGNIFQIIPGPEKLQPQELHQFFSASHQLEAKYLAKNFGIAYHCVSDASSLEEALTMVFGTSGEVQLLEIKTDGETSATYLRAYFNLIQNAANI
ncbi:MAG: 2-succinyl-5-enolpyruvyl-6-hydroxy-3-cyclohexene-1-carboxylic-acid synthase [Chitinophagales bacterium]|nr:2-succinyl-5-enolpyruvyl-6-hydroxy-3-cyclohexene-1-carboxylic-acid synthase [Bacteroidota bacterium]MCB9042313.1 2-succinyl-5-enolpyruvyl-6-hydroxy-3-cyclohexene-1-carboxylic-acid synthase [Chitinophagales bacterium]